MRSDDDKNFPAIDVSKRHWYDYDDFDVVENNCLVVDGFVNNTKEDFIEAAAPKSKKTQM